MAAFLGLAVLALLLFTQARDLRRLREWAGSAPERDTERKQATSAVAAQRAEELRALEDSRTAERTALESREERRRRREAGLPEQTTSERLREGVSGFGGRLGEPRYLIGVFVAFLVVVAIAGFLVLGGGDDGTQASNKGNNQGGQNQKQQQQKQQQQTAPAEIEVTVLNGTAVSGLAAEIGDTVESSGFQLGAVGNTNGSFADSVVMYQRGSAPEAKQVANALGIPSVELMTVEVETAAEGAPVAVIAGEDNAAAAG